MGIDGNGVGPKLEMREVLYIFENSSCKSIQLEDEAIRMSGLLLEMTGKAAPNMGEGLARDALAKGSAYEKFKQIIGEQGGDAAIGSDKLAPKAKSITFTSVIQGTIRSLYNKKVIEFARILGCPLDKDAGIYFYKSVGEKVGVKDKMFTAYSSTEDRLNLALGYMQKNNLFEIIPD